VESLALQYLAKYPICRQFAKDWVAHDDLKYMSVHYYYNRDPVFFLRHLAASPNFPDMVKKYAMHAPIQGFVKDAMKRVPSDSLSAGMDFVSNEPAVKPVIDSVMQSVGIPPAMLASSASSGGPPKFDEKAMMNSVMSSNPEMQMAASQTPEIGKTLQSVTGSKQ